MVVDKTEEKIEGVEDMKNKGSRTNLSVGKSGKLLTKRDLKKHYDMLNSRFEEQLMDKKNYKLFYWAPDYSFCGFATKD